MRPSNKLQILRRIACTVARLLKPRFTEGFDQIQASMSNYVFSYGFESPTHSNSLDLRFYRLLLLKSVKHVSEN